MTKDRSLCDHETSKERRRCRCITTSTTNLTKSASSAPYKEAIGFSFKGDESVTLPVVVANNLKKLKDSTKADNTVESTNISESKAKLVSNTENSVPRLSAYEVGEKLPLVPPREQGSFCALEINVLEKHTDGCSKKKQGMEGKPQIEDKVGSYDVISRLVYRTCTGSDGDSTIRNSAKSFRLNDPDAFGKELKECRSRVETIPILHFFGNCALKDQLFPPAAFQPPQKAVVSSEIRGSIERASPNPPEILSVYVRTDRNKKVPDGFQKMHYRGDSCKLHDPTERSKQILALQKIIAETTSGAELSRSTKAFPSDTDVRVMPAAVAGPMQMPKTIFAPPVDLRESDESLMSYKHLYEQESETDSADSLLPPRRIALPTEDRSKRGIFGGCFGRKHKRQQDDHAEEESYYRGRNLVRNENLPTRLDQMKDTPSSRKEYLLHGGRFT